MQRYEFKDDETYLPATLEQFQSLTNEMVEAMNVLIAPNTLTYDYMAQMLNSAIHSYDHKIGVVSKQALFENCLNRISCHITFYEVERIQQRLNEENQKKLEEGKDEEESPETVIEEIM
jgi:hypothetical protein